jgi:DNA-binding response OmpR family regulator
VKSNERSSPPSWNNGMDVLRGTGIRVLVVEDDDDVRSAIGDRLTHSGFVVFEARDGIQALAEMRARHFHVVITDCHMPHLNGLDFLRQCRQHWPTVPVIFLSASSDATEELATEFGAFACLRKPFEPDRLIALICKAAGLPPSHSASRTSGR